MLTKRPSNDDVVHWQKKRSRTAIPAWVCRDYIEYCHWYKKIWIRFSKKWITKQKFHDIMYFKNIGEKALRAYYTSTEDSIFKPDISDMRWYSHNFDITIDIPDKLVAEIEMLRILPLVKHKPFVPKALWTFILSFATEPYNDCDASDRDISDDDDFY